MNKFFYLAILLLIPSFQLFAQTKRPPPHFIGLFVANLDSALVWYRDKLEFKIIDKVQDDSTKAKFALISWNGLLMEMIEHPQVVLNKQIKENLPETIGNQGFFKLGFYIQDLESLQDKLKSKGVKITYPILKAEGFSQKLKLFIIEDYEGNMIQFYNFLNSKHKTLKKTEAGIFITKRTTNFCLTDTYYRYLFSLYYFVL